MGQHVVQAEISDGIVIRNTRPETKSSFKTVPDYLKHHASENQERIAISDLATQQRVTYGELWARAQALATGLTRFDLTPDRPIAILSGNSIDHAVLMFAGMLLGVPVSPISAAYSQFSDLGRITDLLTRLTPGIVYAEDADAFARGLDVARSLGAQTLASFGSGANHLLNDIEESGMGEPVDVRIGAETIAKILFTSGSTGAPKGVLVTQKMMCSNQDALAAEWPFLAEEPPVVVDWLPWNHVYGSNLVINSVIRNGGTLLIDDGRPVPGQFEKTLTNLAEHRPSIQYGVPRGFEMLVPALEADADLAKAYFSRLRRMVSAGAAMTAEIWDRYQALAAKYGRKDFVAHVAWGATETAPVITLTPDDNTQPDNLGVPVQGCEVKMVPNADKLELRIKGPMVTPGYWRNEKATADAFDEDGFYKMGDAGRLLDGDPAKGIVFDGRISENFKLITGTWVQVNSVRLATIDALSPAVLDVVVTGHDRNEVGVLLFMDLDGCRDIIGTADTEISDLLGHPKLRNHISDGLAKIGRNGGSSGRVKRALILSEEPSKEDGEMTDKGYLNQRAALRKHGEAVVRLFENPSAPDVVLPAS